MDLTTLLWILGVFASCVGTMALGYNLLSQRLAVVETKQGLRDKFFEELERRAMELLHRDNDMFRLDKIVERYRIQNHYLSMNDWKVLKDKCEAIFKDKTISTDERLLASLAIALAEHKLSVMVERKPLV